MDATQLFFAVFAAVMSAGLLLCWFVWGAITYARYEREGVAGAKGTGGAAAAFGVPLLFNLVALLIALDRVPDWLNFILQ